MAGMATMATVSKETNENIRHDCRDANWQQVVIPFPVWTTGAGSLAQIRCPHWPKDPSLLDGEPQNSCQEKDRLSNSSSCLHPGPASDQLGPRDVSTDHRFFFPAQNEIASRHDSIKMVNLGCPLLPGSGLRGQQL